MWPFKKKPKTPSHDDMTTSNTSRDEIMQIFREQAIQEGLEPPPDDAEIVVMPGAMTGDEARRWEQAMRKRMSLPPSTRRGSNDPD
jgi:hypothetical protein